MKFYQHFRMSKHQFNYLLQKNEKGLKKKNTTFRDAKSPVEKPATCLDKCISSSCNFTQKALIEVTEKQ
jgi:hypothetical protein